MKRVLLVSYFWPPIAGSGVFRPLRLAKYLSRLDWQVTVLTVTQRVRLMKDESLVAEVPTSVAVERTWTLEPRNALLALNKLGLRAITNRIAPWLNLPDEQRGWVPFALRRARQLHRHTPFDAVITTSHPYSAHLIGLALRRSERIPWIADFRDEWTTNPYIDYPSGWHQRRNEALENEVLTTADRVVCVSEPWLDNLRELIPAQPANKFREITNGFDPEHFTGPFHRRPDKFRILYAGAFYGHRRPASFLAALDKVLADGRLRRSDVEVSLVGPTAGAPELELPSLDHVTVFGHRPYFEVNRLMSEAAALLLVIPTAGGVGNHTGKLFAYLASGQPILALAPEHNVAAKIVRESRSGVVASPDEVDAIAAALATLYQRWRDGGAGEDQDREYLARFTGQRHAAAFAALLDELVLVGGNGDTKPQPMT